VDVCGLELNAWCGRAGRAGARVAFYLTLTTLAASWGFGLVRLGASPMFVGLMPALIRHVASGWLAIALALLVGHELARATACALGRALCGFSPEAYASEVAALTAEVGLLRGSTPELTRRAVTLLGTSYRARSGETLVWAGRVRLMCDARADSFVVITTRELIVISGPNSATRNLEIEWREVLGWTAHEHRCMRVHLTGGKDLCFMIPGDRRDASQDPAVFDACLRARTRTGAGRREPGGARAQGVMRGVRGHRADQPQDVARASPPTHPLPYERGEGWRSASHTREARRAHPRRCAPT
jgi:hypothetical protein